MTKTLDDSTVRGNIIQNILGHSKGAPSLTEIDYYNPDTNESEIKEHLDVLINSGLVIRLTIPESRRQPEKPDTFFALTERGWRTLEQHDIFVDKIDEIRHDHARVEKTTEIKSHESAPRPDFPREAYSTHINP